MANEAAVGFTFDPSGIVAGAKKGVAAIESINARVKMASNVVLGYLGMKGIGAALPELGKTASIAGDIIQRNLFWPLRQELAPILNKFLAWVRDSRGMFVRWGGYLVGVFRIIKGVIEGIWEFMKKMASVFNKFVENVFGKTTKTVGQTMNMLLGKVALLVALLMVALEPLANFFGKLFGFIFVGTAKFFEGIGSQLPGIIEEIHELAQAFSDLSDEIFGSGESAVGFGEFMKKIGILVGGVLRIILFLIKHIVGGVKDMIEWFKETFNYISSAKSIPEGVLRTIESIFSGIASAIKWVIDGLSGLSTKLAQLADDVGLKKLGDIFRSISNFFAKTSKQIESAVKNLREFFQLIGEATGILDKKVVDGKDTKQRFASGYLDTMFADDPKKVDQLQKLRINEYKAAKAKGVEYKSSLPWAINKLLDTKYGTVEMTYNVNLNVTEGNATQAGKNFNKGIDAEARKAIQNKRTATGR